MTLTLAQRISLLTEAMEFRLRYRIGRLLFPFESLLRSERFLLLFKRVKRYDSIVAQSNYDRLPPETLADLLQIQQAQVDRSAQHRAIRYRVDNQTLHATDNDYAFAAREVAKLLHRFPNLVSVANIGARVDVVTNYLSAQYPQRSFTSIDLQSNLAEHNRYFERRPNWEFKSGYIIELLEQGMRAPDMAIMMFTSCKLTEGEFDRFLRCASNTKAILILATYKPNPDSVLKFHLERPDRLAQSYVTSPTLLDPDIPSYVFVHNYAKMLAAHGFTIEQNTIRKSPSPIRQGASVFITAFRNLQ